MAGKVRRDFWFHSEDGAQMFCKWANSEGRGSKLNGSKHQVEVIHSGSHDRRVEFLCEESQVSYVLGICEGIEFTCRDIITG